MLPLTHHHSKVATTIDILKQSIQLFIVCHAVVHGTCRSAVGLRFKSGVPRQLQDLGARDASAAGQRQARDRVDRAGGSELREAKVPLGSPRNSTYGVAQLTCAQSQQRGSTIQRG